jgi:hypothetical protein
LKNEDENEVTDQSLKVRKTKDEEVHPPVGTEALTPPQF